MNQKRLLSLLLCAVLAFCALTGCASNSSSAASASSESVPSSTVKADTPQIDFDENSIFAFSTESTAEAFAPCLGWGPGVSGSSLKSVTAAASLLNWAEQANLSSRTEKDIKAAYTEWYDGLTSDEQESFADAWPLIKEAANDILTKSGSNDISARLEDAGVDMPECSEKNWDALLDVVDALVPQSSEY